MHFADRNIVAMIVLFTFSVAQTGLAQTSTPLTVDLIMQGPNLAGYQPQDVRWSEDSRSIYFRWKEASEPFDEPLDTWVASRDGKGLRRLTDDEANHAPPIGGEETPDHKRIVYEDDGDIFLFDSATGRRRNLTSTTAAESNPEFTKDVRRVAFTRDQNLFVVSLVDGSIEQMTNIAAAGDSGPRVKMWDEKRGTASQESLKKEERKLIASVDRRAKRREEREARAKKEHPRKSFKLQGTQSVAGLRLSPDETLVIASITTESDGAKTAIVPTYVTESAYTETLQARENVGDASEVTSIAVIDVASGESKWLKHGLGALEPLATEEPKKDVAAKDATATATAPPAEEKKTEESASRTEKSEATQTESAIAKEREVGFENLVWSDDGRKLILLARAADNKDRWILALDPASASARVIVAIHDDAWINWLGSDTVGFLPDNETIYYMSEQTGFMHLYTVPFSGGSPTTLTSGNWEVVDVVLSRDKKSFYLTTGEQSPFERHLYEMPARGGSPTKLTTIAGNHAAVVSPDGSRIADVFSYTNKPPELFVSTKSKTSERSRITTSPAPEFSQRAWLDAPIVMIPARDGARVPARIYRPQNYRAGGPAVVFVHGAGYLQNVHRWWSSYYREYMFHHLLMERGYLVLDLDYRGSAGYGRDWRTAIYRHMGGKDLNDQIDAARWLAREQGVDPKRIGIYGGSYGGFITFMAMFTEPDVFAAGAALRPVTDWAHYNHPYTSNILNAPQNDAEAYRRSSPIYFAEGLKGALLICHGMADVNVHFQDSVRLAQRLIELRKEHWELAVYPVEDHAFVEPASWADEYKRILKLFETNLK